MTAALAASGGHQWLISSPGRRRGFFYEAWEHGGESWTRIAVPVTGCPRISAPFLAAYPPTPAATPLLATLGALPAALAAPSAGPAPNNAKISADLTSPLPDATSAQ